MRRMTIGGARGFGWTAALCGAALGIGCPSPPDANPQRAPAAGTVEAVPKGAVGAVGAYAIDGPEPRLAVPDMVEPPPVRRIGDAGGDPPSLGVPL